MEGHLVLADGTVYRGKVFGSRVSQISEGEVVFNTSLTGYQELLTDPSYCGQIVIMTNPLVGNYGINSFDFESDRIQVKGLIVREVCDKPNHWQMVMTLPKYLESENIIGLTGIDTRALTRQIRKHGTMKGILCAGARSPAELKRLAARARESRGAEGQDLTALVSTPIPYRIQDSPNDRSQVDPLLIPDLVKPITEELQPSRAASGVFRVVAIDYGIKKNILRRLFHLGCETIVVPQNYPAAKILALKPDGILLSNGPGDPKAVKGAPETVSELVNNRIPILAICLGHQILALALGGNTRKMKFGHRGGNHPVVNPRNGKLFITAQNHGYVVEEESLDQHKLEVIARNVNDSTLEGFRHRELPIIAVQYHPEGNPGPDDSDYLFREFYLMMQSARH